MSSTRSLSTPGPLTPRQVQILQLIAEGLSNEQIANRLRLSAETVKSHVSAVHAKLGADSRAHAVAIAFRHGLLR